MVKHPRRSASSDNTSLSDDAQRKKHHAHTRTGGSKRGVETQGSPIRQARATEAVQGALLSAEKQSPEGEVDDRQRPLLWLYSDR